MSAGAADPRLYRPTPARVRLDADGRPCAVEGRTVEAIREDWVVEDRWWSPPPLRRRYFEVLLTGGRCTVIYRDLVNRSWHQQRG